MNIKIVVEVDLKFTSGKFESRDDLTQKLTELLEDADPSTITGDNEGEYEVTGWSADELPPEKKKGK